MATTGSGKDWFARVLALLSLLVAGFGAWNSDRQYQLNRRSAEPVLALEVDDLGPLKPGTYEIRARIKNIGNAPAFNVHAYGTLDPYKWMAISDTIVEIPITGQEALEPKATMSVPVLHQLILSKEDIEIGASMGWPIRLSIDAERDDVSTGSRIRVSFSRTYDRKTGRWMTMLPRLFTGRS